MRDLMYRVAGVCVLMLVAGQTTLYALPNWDIYSDAVIEEGDEYANVYIYDTPPDHTTVNMSGGSAYNILTYDSSILNVTGGTAEVYPHNENTVNMSGGYVPTLWAYDASSVNASGGSVYSLHALHTSVVYVLDDVVIDVLVADDYGLVNVSGGIVDHAGANESGTLNLSGGSVSDCLWTYGPGIINLYGYDLAKFPSGGHYGYGFVTGQWQDWTPFNIDLNGSETYSHTILHEIPEPSTIYYVDAVHGDNDNNGLRPETAFATIQKGIDSAKDGDIVIVANGTYTGPGNHAIDFKGKAITVKSQNGPEKCIIDCQHSNLGFHFHNGEDSNSVIDGFTITNGYGGGIYCRESSPTISRCNISNSRGDRGGGIDCRDNSCAIITNCTITGNMAGMGGGIAFRYGSNATVSRCVIIGNLGYDAAGGIWCTRSTVTLTNCAVIGNVGVYGGGGISCQEATLTAINCTFADNSAPMGNFPRAL